MKTSPQPARSVAVAAVVPARSVGAVAAVAAPPLRHAATTSPAMASAVAVGHVAASGVSRGQNRGQSRDLRHVPSNALTNASLVANSVLNTASSHVTSIASSRVLHGRSIRKLPPIGRTELSANMRVTGTPTPSRRRSRAVSVSSGRSVRTSASRKAAARASPTTCRRSYAIQ